MKWHHALDNILGSTIKIRLLRVLSKNTGVFTGRELARVVGYSHTHTNSTLAELEMSGLVIKRHVGNSNTYSLNQDNLLVSRIIVPAFRVEERLLQDLANRFYNGLGEDLVSVILYGSVARGEEGPGSDIDIVLVVKDEVDLNRIDEKVSEISLESAIAFGCLVSPVLVTESEYADKQRSKSSFWRFVVEEGVGLTPAKQEEIWIG